jgi:transcription-repair coupling factor (superfamily II helicase)
MINQASFISMICVVSSTQRCCAFEGFLVVLNKEIEVKGMIQEEKKSGFVAGTLVHTDKGLVPIEQLSVGDMVLSRPDTDSNAPNAYKRVVSTFKSSEKKRIQLLGIVNSLRNNDWDIWASSPPKFPTNTMFEAYLVTGEHPIWIEKAGWASESLGDSLGRQVLFDEKLGWQSANFFDIDIELKLFDGADATCTLDGNTYALRTTDIEGLLYEDAGGPTEVWDVRSNQIESYNPMNVLIFEEREDGDYEAFILESDLPQALIDFGRFWFSPRRALHIYGAEVVKTFSEKPNFKLRESQVQVEEKDTQSRLYASDYVYNIEVDDYHTYFIGKLGLWVHDASANIS